MYRIDNGFIITKNQLMELPQHVYLSLFIPSMAKPDKSTESVNWLLTPFELGFSRNNTGVKLHQHQLLVDVLIYLQSRGQIQFYKGHHPYIETADGVIIFPGTWANTLSSECFLFVKFPLYKCTFTESIIENEKIVISTADIDSSSETTVFKENPPVDTVSPILIHYPTSEISLPFYDSRRGNSGMVSIICASNYKFNIIEGIWLVTLIEPGSVLLNNFIYKDVVCAFISGPSEIIQNMEIMGKMILFHFSTH